MDILAVQQRVLDKGWQFAEFIFNDGKQNNCLIKIRQKPKPSLFIDGEFKLGDLHWGRFPRMEAWKMVAEFLDEIEFRDSIPENVKGR